MGGPVWTTPELHDLEWLESRVPRYSELLLAGAARKKNPPRDAFVAETYEQYDLKFPGQIAKFGFTRIRTSGTDVEQKVKMIECLKWCFDNQLCKAKSGRAGKQDVIDLSGKATMARNEKKFDTYARLYKDHVETALSTAWKAHLTECGTNDSKPTAEIAFRNKHLSQMLAEEPEEVQRKVTKNQMTAAKRTAQSRPKWEDEDVCGPGEIAFDLHKYDDFK